MRVETVRQEYHKNDNIEQHTKNKKQEENKTASMDSVIEIGKRIQAEISSTLQPNNYKIALKKEIGNQPS